MVKNIGLKLLRDLEDGQLLNYLKEEVYLQLEHYSVISTVVAFDYYCINKSKKFYDTSNSRERTACRIDT